MLTKLLIFLISFFIVLSPLSLYPTPLVNLSSGDTINIIPEMEISEKFKNSNDIQEVLKSQDLDWDRAGRNDMVLYKEPGTFFWIRFDILNNTNADREVFIRLKEFVLDSVTCYIVFNKNEIMTYNSGIREPLSHKVIKSVDSIFPLEVRKNEKVSVYISLKAEIFTAFYINLYNTNGIFDHLIKHNFFIGIFFGCVIFMGVLCISILFYIKDTTYLFYLFFLISDAIFQFSRVLLGIYFIYPEHPNWNISIWYSSHVISFMFATLFFRHFLNLKMYNTTLDKISHYMAYIILLFLPMPYIFNENTFYIALAVGFLYTITVFIASIHVYGKGFKPAKYFIMAWGFLIIGVMASSIATKNNFIREYASMIGSILQMIFIVFAILSKTKRIQKEKDQISLEISGMRRELDMAKKIQLSLLPEKPPKIKGCDIGTYYLPMKEIGGDFYDFYEKDDKSFSCLVADVSGHGAAAALIASMLKVSFASTADLYNQPREALLKMNRSLLGNLGKKFVTAVYAHIDLREKTLTYSSAGHPAILVQRRSEQRIIYLEPKGQFLGWFEDIKLREYTFSIEIGDRILIYTDGLIEAFNDKHVMFDYDHLEEALMKNTSLSAEGLTYFLGYHIKEWVGFTRDFEDDITLVTVDIV